MAGALSGQMTITGSIGTFAAPSRTPVILTIYLDNLPAGGVSDFIVRPMKAIQLLPIQSSAAGGLVALDFFNLGGGNTAIYTLSYPIGTVTPTPVPISGDVGAVRITNLTGGVANFRLPFQLAM